MRDSHFLSQDMVDFTMKHWKQIGITDEDVAELAARKQCHIGASLLPWREYTGKYMRDVYKGRSAPFVPSHVL